MNILVTGSRGYIGPVLMSLLMSQGHKVKGIDSNLFYNCPFIGTESEELFKATDIKDVREVEKKDLEGFDCIIHLAALSNDPMGEIDPYLTQEINYLASVRLAYLAKQAGVRKFIFSSSCSVYGSNPEMVRESSPTNPLTAYAVSKAKAEREIADLAGSTFSPVFMRNATVYGFSPMFRVDLAVNNLTAIAYTTGKIQLNSDGQSHRPFVSIRDLAVAFTMIAEADPELVHNEIFNIGSDYENYRIITIAEIIKNIMPSCEITFSPGAQPDKRNYSVSFTKLRKYFPHFKTAFHVNNEVPNMLDKFALHSFSLSDMSIYSRLDELKRVMSSGTFNSKLYLRS